MAMGVSNGANGVEIWKRIPVPFPANWAGWVSVTAGQNVVAVGRPHIGAQIMAYTGFTGGNLNAFIPMLFKGAFGGVTMPRCISKM